MSKRINFILDKKAAALIKRLQAGTGAGTMAEVIRRSVGLYHWFYEKKKQGFTVVTMRDGKAVSELVFDVFDFPDVPPSEN